MSSVPMKQGENGSLSELSELVANWVDARFNQQPPESWDIEIVYGFSSLIGAPTMELVLTYSTSAKDGSGQRTHRDSRTVTMRVRERNMEQLPLLDSTRNR